MQAGAVGSDHGQYGLEQKSVYQDALSDLEVVYATLKDGLILVAEDVLVQVVAAALRVAHLAENSHPGW